MSYFLLVIGFGFLAKGADFLVNGSVSLAKRFRVSEIVIGLTIVAFGTSAPELVVNIIGSISGAGELIVGNIVGSNIANLALVLGIAGLFAPLAIRSSLIRKEIPLGLIGAILIYLLATNSGDTLTLERLSGALLLLGFFAFLYFIYRAICARKYIAETDKTRAHTIGTAIGLTLGGLVGLTLGGKLVVDNAIIIATNFGISEGLVGLTLVALGTSLPELTTSVVAVRKGKTDLAVGNAVGSNIFNIFWVLGLSAVIRPIVFNQKIGFDIAFLVAITALLIGLAFFGKKYELARWQAALFLTSYLGYIWFIVQRG